MNHEPKLSGYKVCSRCEVEQPVINFQPDKRSLDRLHSWCRPCLRAKRKEWREHIPKTEPVMKGTKICSMCKKELPVLFFSVRKTSKDGLSSNCRECHRQNRPRNIKSLNREHALFLRGDV